MKETIMNWSEKPKFSTQEVKRQENYYELAYKELNLSIRIKPNDETVYKLICYVLNQKKFEKSILGCNYRIVFQPDNYKAYRCKFNFNICCFNGQYYFPYIAKIKKVDEQIQCLEQCIQMRPKIFWSQNQKANVLAKLNNFNESILCCNKFIQLYPSQLKAYEKKGISQTLNKIAKALTKLGKFNQSIQCYNQYIQLKSKNIKSLLEDS